MTEWRYILTIREVVSYKENTSGEMLTSVVVGKEGVTPLH
jgi:hypothetical protein